MILKCEHIRTIHFGYYIIIAFVYIKFINHLFFSSDHFYESKLQEESIDKKIDKLEKKQERKNRIMKILGQRINVLNMKIEILQNFKKNKNLNSIKKQIQTEQKLKEKIYQLKDRITELELEKKNNLLTISKLTVSKNEYTELEKNKNEKKGNDSESFIIEGYSEYGDANVF